MNNQKAFVSIIAALLILAAGSVALYQYSQHVDRRLGGSLVSGRYGGTATDTSAWNGLLRLTTGEWATTTLVDDDIPNDITITTLPNEVTFASSSITNLTAGTSTFTGTTTFQVIPTLPTATATTDYQIPSKAYVDNTVFIIPIASTSTNLKASADTEQTTSGTTYTKIKEIQVRLCGTMRVAFDLKRSGGTTAYGQIYINGVAVGVERSNSSDVYVTYTEDIPNIQTSDLIQLYYKNNSGASTEIRNFRIYWDVTPTTTFSKVILN
jgi:hypothetical protein